jgi:hypothetical protein
MLVADDLVINAESCNLSCSYFLAGQSNFKEGHVDQRIFDLPLRDNCHPESDLGRCLVLEVVKTAHDRPVVKLTGGEIFLLRDIVEPLLIVGVSVGDDGENLGYVLDWITYGGACLHLRHEFVEALTFVRWQPHRRTRLGLLDHLSFLLA